MPQTRSSTKASKNPPVDSSTPYNDSARPSGRPPIRKHLDSGTDLPSPISSYAAVDSDETSESDPNDSSPETSEQTNITTQCNSVSKTTSVFYFVLPIIVLAVATFALNLIGNQDAEMPHLTIEDIENRFPSQSKYLWKAFESGLKDVKEFTKPSVFLLLYEDESQITVNELVSKISEYSICFIKGNCSLKPIVLSNEILSSERALLDYGNLLHEYKPELEKRGVVIVNNLEQVKGKAAQMFHTICDEISPLVKEAVIIFTVKIQTFPQSEISDIKLVENILHAKWSDIEDDTFNPLFTRITSIVMRVHQEK